MNRTKLKNYAPKARRDFIQAMTDRAAYYGLTAKKVEPVVERGDVAVIAGREFPRVVAEKRRALEVRIQRHGFGPTMEAMAYTWFNRLVAIRFMELHGYLDHGYRVLSHTEGRPTPEIMEQAEHVELPGLRKEAVIDLKLAGNRESELYRMLLTAQCNALHIAMPFLFERIDDETDLLLPDNLLNSDSLIRKLVSEIDEDDWREVEIIGWLYQFYISEKKDEVIGKVVASEDIPAATQLFTPNWIVKYLVQNTLGRQWLATYPQSTLRQQMRYYVAPAEQPPEVQGQLKAITPISLNPEELTLLDPACGSGHILVEAYDLMKAIYQERGYQARSIPRLILENNLYGLDIDDRAAQMAGFALMMKARTDDRRLLDSPIQLHVCSLQESKGMELDEFAGHLQPFGISRSVLGSLLDAFEYAKTFGSLIQIPEVLERGFRTLTDGITTAIQTGDVFAQTAAKDLLPLIVQAKILAMKFDSVVANPPYMGASYFNGLLAKFVGEHYKEWSGDLLTCFIKSNLDKLKDYGSSSLITIATWTFLPTYEEMRSILLRSNTVLSIIDNGRGVWGSDHGTIMFSIQKRHVEDYVTSTRGLSRGKGKVQHVEEIERRFLTSNTDQRRQKIYLETSSCVISVGVTERFIKLLANERKLSDIGAVRQGIKTGEISRFVRFWHEVPFTNIYLDCPDSSSSKRSQLRWYPCNKGGEYRKWYGNLDHVLNWQNDGNEIRNFKDEVGRLRSRPQNIQYFFKNGVTWSTVTMGKPSFRYSSVGRTFESGGSTIFFDRDDDLYFALGVINSHLGEQAVTILSPKVSLGEGAVSSFPIPQVLDGVRVSIVSNAKALVESFIEIESETETSPDFRRPTLWGDHGDDLLGYYLAVQDLYTRRLAKVSNLETANDQTISAALGDPFSPPEVVEWSDYGVVTPTRERFSIEFLSYFIGCATGRYSLDMPGLVYANQQNEGFDGTRYTIFPADADGLVAVTDELWFEVDAGSRIREFLVAVWGAKALDENMAWLADSLGVKTGETPDETIRRYLASAFYKNHLSMYKKRPIYWLFTSGKQRAFQCLVYLHRYTDATLARMRTEYVIPLQGQIAARIEQLEGDKAKATSTSYRKKLQKEQDDLKKQRTELLTFEEKLKHAADQKIALDLDDGVTVNYGKFGDLLAESKAITGSSDNE